MVGCKETDFQEFGSRWWELKVVNVDIYFSKKFGSEGRERRQLERKERNGSLRRMLTLRETCVS